jgi:hypothetical protein
MLTPYFVTKVNCTLSTDWQTLIYITEKHFLKIYLHSYAVFYGFHSLAIKAKPKCLANPIAT